jgi:hypothetical protein
VSASHAAASIAHIAYAHFSHADISAASPPLSVVEPEAPLVPEPLEPLVPDPAEPAVAEDPAPPSMSVVSSLVQPADSAATATHTTAQLVIFFMVLVSLAM